MSRNNFFGLLLLTWLAVGTPPASASPMVAQVGSASVTIVLSPDPPRVGVEHVTITVAGANPDALARTRASFVSSMPSMSMAGPAGNAIPITSQPGRWTFDFATAYATAWTLGIRFSGGLTGSATYNFAVAAEGSQAPSGGAMAMTAGHESVWRTAAIALAILAIVAGLAAWSAARTAAQTGRPVAWISRNNLLMGAAAVVVVLGVAFLQSAFAPPSMDMAAMQSVQGSAPLPVTLVQIDAKPMNPVIAAPGTVQAYLTQDVVTRAPGILRDFTAYNGARVFAGETLAILDEPELGAQAAAASAGARSDRSAAEAAVIEAHHHAPNEVVIARADAVAKEERARYWQAEMQREKVLLDNGAVSQQEYDDERAQAAAALSDAEAARRGTQDALANLAMTSEQATSAQQRAASSQAAASAAAIMAGYTRIVAQDDGFVVKRLVDPGTFVQAGTLVLRIAVISRVRIQASVAQEDLPNVLVGAALDATLPGGRTIHANVTSVQPAADPTTHTAIVEALVDNAEQHLIPGTFVRVAIQGSRSRNRSTVDAPSAAIVGAGADTSVWVDVNGTAHRVSVRVYSDDGTTAQVLGDLKTGDRVVVEGSDNLEEGAPIAERSP